MTNGTDLPAKIRKLTAPKLGEPIQLQQWNTREDGGFDKQEGMALSSQNVLALDALAYRLYAENAQSLLIILQGMDTAGKDGVIRHVLEGISPLSAEVSAFKQPSHEELSHDFLWRIHQKVPGRGKIGVFNRSQYEDVLVVRVDSLVPPAVWKPRYETINHFERLLTEARCVTVLKFYLHISKEEQLARLQARLDDPHKRWKFSQDDVAKRKQWDDYRIAYEDALTKCHTRDAPWHVIPADRKWFRNLAVSTIVRQTLETMDPQFPQPDPGLDALKLE